LLHSFINGVEDPVGKVKKEFSSEYPDIVSEIEDVEKSKINEDSVQALVKKFGLSCPLPGK